MERAGLIPEPTSALDTESSKKVEKSLLGMLPPLKTRHSAVSARTGQLTRDDGADGQQGGVERRGTGPKALVWITHEDAQAERVGTRTVNLSRQ